MWPVAFHEDRDLASRYLISLGTRSSARGHSWGSEHPIVVRSGRQPATFCSCADARCIDAVIVSKAKALGGTLLSDEQVRRCKQHMQMAVDLAEEATTAARARSALSAGSGDAGGGVVGGGACGFGRDASAAAVIVDPAQNKVVACGVSGGHGNHPLKHAVIVAIDLVAKLQCESESITPVENIACGGSGGGSEGSADGSGGSVSGASGSGASGSGGTAGNADNGLNGDKQEEGDAPPAKRAKVGGTETLLSASAATAATAAAAAAADNAVCGDSSVKGGGAAAACSDSNAAKGDVRGPYLCTNYDVYLSSECCM